jgi:excisionase family DNA binding protein
VLGVNLIEKLEARSGAMKVAELCDLLGVDDKHIYRMAARGSLPSFRVGGAVRFDPQEVAKWLRAKYGVVSAEGRKPPTQVRAARTQESRLA